MLYFCLSIATATTATRLPSVVLLPAQDMKELFLRLGLFIPPSVPSPAVGRATGGQEGAGAAARMRPRPGKLGHGEWWQEALQMP